MQATSETRSVTETPQALAAEDILNIAVSALDDNKAEEITSINLAGKTSIADYMVIASGRSQRQVAALADYVIKGLKAEGHRDLLVQGQEQADCS